MEKSDAWVKYLTEYFVAKKENPNVLVEEDLSNILNEISNEDFKNKIVNKLVSLDYNPLTDVFPSWEFDKETQKKLVKIISYIKTHYYINNDVKLRNGLWGKVVYKSKSFNKNDYANDFIIAFNSWEFDIVFSDSINIEKTKKERLLKYLQGIKEENTFILISNSIHLIIDDTKESLLPFDYITTSYENELETIKGLIEGYA